LAPENAAAAASAWPLDWLSALGEVSQAVIAVVAVFLALRANRINKDALVLQQLMGMLFALASDAERVRASYSGLFKAFPDTTSKIQARTAWLTMRESVHCSIDNLCGLFHELAPVREAWEELEDEEDSHARSDAVSLPALKLSGDACRKYERAHQSFLARLTKVMRMLRADGLHDGK
jgi:hypothetical protein